ncbi:zinc ABC transporter substrate-binding protein [Clostridium gasigenes]|uniref:metal ABC transporter solute-binding protein, Zn/Mn family n=1 Tax=Clostridium gasigenes TaxID=94869 RepID=UPI001438552D|nr:zinc ABC transporter substrate-binding protein [Clostridium gasigenes]NKF06349.1 zinc ABC transporter solute-binding protein [Clostridium gasigenes]QSW20232.1 zinc ABC transporter substrate-binding protein [Clostridium gasigenes]
MKKKLIATVMIVLGLVTTIGCSTKENNNETGKVRVGVTISPLKEFAEIIGGDKVEVFSIIPQNSDPHSFEPKPKDLASLNNSDIFVYNGLKMESWIDPILKQIENKDVEIVNSSNGVDIIEISQDEHAGETAEEHAKHEEEEHANETAEEHAGHDHGTQDPHIWLSLKEATKQAENIKNALVLKDEVNKDYYEENFRKLKKDFNDTYEEYAKKFENISNKNFVTGHAAFGYLCRDFGLTQNSLIGIYGGEGEIPPGDFKEILEYCKENNIKTIFSESAASSSQSEALARDAGAKVEKIYSLETKVDNMSYLEGTRYNYEKIYEALK